MKLSAAKLDNETIIKRFLTAVEDNNSKDLMELWHEQGIWQYSFAPPTFPKQLTGPDAVVKNISLSSKFFLNLKFNEIEISQTSDMAVAFAEFKSKAVVRKTGLDYHNSYCGKFVIENKKIVLFRDYFDSYKTAKYLGLI